MKGAAVYFEIQWKRLKKQIASFLLTLFVLVLFLLSMFLLGREYMPKVLEIQPFRVSVVVEGEDFLSQFVRDCLGQMESVNTMIQFVDRPDPESIATITIPSKTPQSIMSGENIPITVSFPKRVRNMQWYLQAKWIEALAECGATYIDVAQTETALLYEMRMKNPEDLEQIVDFFHLALVTGREDWIKTETLTAFGNHTFATYYLTAAVVLLCLMWPLGMSGFVTSKSGFNTMLYERIGISYLCQYFTTFVVFLLPYVGYGFVLMLARYYAPTTIQNLDFGWMLCMIVMVAAQSYAILLLFKKNATGMCGLFLWNLIWFIGAGGILPEIFLPPKLVTIAGFTPPGMGLNSMLKMAGGYEVGKAPLLYTATLWLALGLAIEYFRIYWRKGT